MSKTEKIRVKLEEISDILLETIENNQNDQQIKMNIINEIFDDTLDTMIQRYSNHNKINERLQATEVEIKYLTISSADTYNCLETAIRDFYEIVRLIKTERAKNKKEQMIALICEIKYLSEKRTEIHNVDKVIGLLKLKAKVLKLLDCLKKTEKMLQNENRKLKRKFRKIAKTEEYDFEDFDL